MRFNNISYFALPFIFTLPGGAPIIFILCASSSRIMLKASTCFRVSLINGRIFRYFLIVRTEILPFTRAVLMPILCASTSQFGHISVSRHTRISGFITVRAFRTEAIKSTGAYIQVATDRSLFLAYACPCSVVVERIIALSGIKEIRDSIIAAATLTSPTETA